MQSIIQSLLLVTAQVIILLTISPFLVGLIRKVKARFQCRRGASVLQPYADLAKLFRKQPVVSTTTSWIFTATPYILFASTLSAGLLVPTFTSQTPLNFAGNIIALVYLLALGTFFLILAGLDAGSAFGGMGSSRDVSISALIEPALVLALIVAAVTFGSTDLGAIAASGSALGLGLLTPAHVVAAAAFAIVVVAESGHLPVDNPDTHLELTMVHEGMLLEASGRRLALYMLAGQVRQALLIALFMAVFAPWGMAGDMGPVSLLVGSIVFVAKLLIAGQGLALADAVLPKLRILRLPEFIGVAAALALVALAARVWLPA